jgi:hypothetical protein
MCPEGLGGKQPPSQSGLLLKSDCKGHYSILKIRLQKKMRKLMDVVVMYEDQDGRVLSDPFVKLPTRRELPDYYEIIKKPVDITKIQNKIDDGKVKLDTSN